MKTGFQNLLGLLVILALPIFPQVAAAQEYPSRPVTIIVPTPPGGGVDFVGRLIAAELQKALGKPFIVENKGGASGNIGTLQAARAAPDGYTLLLGNSGYQVTNPSLFQNVGWDPIRDFAAVALLVQAPHVMVANKDFPANTVAELIDYAKKNPGKVNYATPGIGTQNHIGSELFAKLAGIKITHIPYRGGAPATTDLVAGTVDIMMNTPQSLVAYLESKSVKGLVVASPQRYHLLPNLPSATEVGLPDLNISTWYALYAPTGTPKEIIDRLSTEIKKILVRDDLKTVLDKNAFVTAYMGPVELTKFTADQVEFWSKAIRSLGITVEQ